MSSVSKASALCHFTVDLNLTREHLKNFLLLLSQCKTSQMSIKLFRDWTMMGR